MSLRRITFSLAAGLAATLTVLAMMQARQDTSLLKYIGVYIVSILFFWFFFSLPKEKIKTVLKNRYLFIGLSVLTLLTCISFINWRLFIERPWYVTFIIVLIALLVIGCFFVSCAAFLLHTGFHFQHVLVKKRLIIYYMLPMIAIWTVYLLAFYPGNMSPDSLNHWRQIQNMEFNNWHPFAYTMVMLVLTSVWESPAAVAVFQIVLMSLVFSYGIYTLRQFGAGAKIGWAAAIVLAISPINGIFSVILWKDVVYSIFIVFLTIMVMKTVLQKGENLRRFSGVTLFTLALLGIAFFRNNGLPIAILTGLGLLVIYRRFWKQLLAPIILVTALYLIVTGPVFTTYHIQSANPNESMSIPTQQIAAVVSQDGELTEEQLAYLDTILPIEDWDSYDPYLTDRIKFHDHFNDEVINADMGHYLAVWFEIVQQNPKLVTEAFLKQTSLVWQINKPEDGYTNPYTIDIDENSMNLVTNPVSDKLYQLVEYGLETSRYHAEEVFWRPAVFTIFILFFTLLASIRLGWKVWLMTLPVLSNTATIFVGLPAQDYRYLVSNSMVCIFFLLVALLHKKGAGRHE